MGRSECSPLVWPSPSPDSGDVQMTLLFLGSVLLVRNVALFIPNIPPMFSQCDTDSGGGNVKELCGGRVGSKGDPECFMVHYRLRNHFINPALPICPRSPPAGIWPIRYPGSDITQRQIHTLCKCLLWSLCQTFTFMKRPKEGHVVYYLWVQDQSFIYLFVCVRVWYVII